VPDHLARLVAKLPLQPGDLVVVDVAQALVKEQGQDIVLVLGGV
jgi:hypothetical protein